MRSLLPIMIFSAIAGLGGVGAMGCTERKAAPPAPPSQEELVRFQALLRDAARLMGEGNTDRARAALEAALQIHPGSADASRLLAATHRKGLNFEQARVILDAAIETHPDDLGLRMERGRVEEILGEYGAARKEFEFIIDRDPHAPGAHLHLGLVELKLNHLAEARAAGRRALELGEEDPETHLLIALASEGLGDLETAEQEYRRSLVKKPGLVEARYRLGHLLRRTGRQEEGAAELQRSARVAGLLVEIERLEGAAESRKVFGTGEGDRQTAILGMASELGRAHLGALRFAETEKRIQEASGFRSLDEGLSYLLGIAIAGQAREEEALRLFQGASQRFPDSARVREAIALLEARLLVPEKDRESPVVLAEKLLER